MSLAGAKTKREYIIVDVKESGLQRRLLDMGFVPGGKIKVTAVAHGTVLVNLRGFNVALRSDAANSIMVEASE